MTPKLLILLVMVAFLTDCKEDTDAIGPCTDGYHVIVFQENCSGDFNTIRVSRQEHNRIRELILNTEGECLPAAVTPKDGGAPVEGYVKAVLGLCEIGGTF